MTWFEFRILKKIFTENFDIFFISFPQKYNEKLMKNFHFFFSNCPECRKRWRRSVLCLEIPSFASGSGIRFIFPLFFFGKYFVSNVSNSIGKMCLWKMSSMKGRKKKQPQRRLNESLLWWRLAFVLDHFTTKWKSMDEKY